MGELARKRGGLCLSKTYGGLSKKLKWQCEKKHVWEIRPQAIIAGRWCSECDGKKIKPGKYSIEFAKSVAESRDGQCLSRNYANSQSKLLWKCAHNHIWEARLSNIYNKNQWCPECAAGIGERIVREFFEQIFDRPFPKVRPQWLRGNAGWTLELDGYCEELGLAFEHQGRHHYSEISFTSIKRRVAKKTHSKTVKNDQIKRQACKAQKVVLFEIPEIPNLLKIEELLPYIIKEAKLKGVELPADLASRQIDTRKAFASNFNANQTQLLRNIASEKGGKLLSRYYLNSDTKLHWMCKAGHKWYARPSTVKYGKWCPKCANVAKLSLQDAHDIAAKHTGKCLSEVYINNKQKLVWKCKFGHIWDATLSDVRNNHSWCPECSGRKPLSLDVAIDIATSRGGKCLSKSYKNNIQKLEWQCKLGHKWKARLLDVRNLNSWCPMCSPTRRLTINDAKEYAASKQGECLSDVYINGITPMRWRCKYGHEWENKLTNMRNKQSWCPDCSGKRKITLTLIKAIAKSHGGKCRSSVIQNRDSKLDFTCAKAHEFSARARRIKDGHWCPECRKSTRIKASTP